MSDFKWFLVALIVLWVLWVASGGYENKENADKQLLRQPAPIQDWQPYRVQDLKW